MMTIRMGRKILGRVAEDKDRARQVRKDHILPTLENERSVRLDFKNVDLATQSFIHALIAEAIQRWGEDILDRIDFDGCNDSVKEVITTVIGYSVRAYELGREAKPGPIRMTDIPQADSLEKIRTVLDTMAGGTSYLQDLEALTGFQYRHLHYRLHAARILGLAKMSRTLAILTESGFRLTDTRPGGEKQRLAFVSAITECNVLQKIAPTLLTAKREPSPHGIAGRIITLTGMSERTAMRRARSIIAWRRQLAVDPQGKLRFVENS